MTRSHALAQLKSALEAKHDGVRLVDWEFENFRKWLPHVAPLVDNADALVGATETLEEVLEHCVDCADCSVHLAHLLPHERLHSAT